MKNMISAFVFGSNVAALILRGILHPDMQLSNFGTRENSEYPGFLDGFFICLDFAEAQKFNIPDDLDDNMIRRLTRSLFPIFQDLKTFSNISYFRAGFVSKCGYLGRELFSNACNSGFSSFAFLNDINNDSMTFSYNPLLQPEIIREWVDFNVDDVSPLKYRSLIEYQRSPERHKISLRNMYYLDNLFFMRSYMVLSELKDETSIIILILNIAMSSLSFNLPVTAYGLFKKCLYLDPRMSEVRQACKDGVKRAMSSGKITNVTDTIISRYLDNDLFGFIWILDDLDRLIPKDEKDLEGML